MYNKSVCVIFVHIDMITLDLPMASTKFSNKMWLVITIDIPEKLHIFVHV